MRSFVVPLVSMFLGCSRVLGIDDLPRHVASPDAGPPPIDYASEECRACVQSACDTQTAACDADPGCRALRECVMKCARSDVSCRATCESGRPAAAKDRRFQDADGCSRGSCTDACYGSRGLVDALVPGCACVDAACATQVEACVRSPASADGRVGSCERRIACLLERDRRDPDAMYECFFQHGDGQDEQNALRACWMRTVCDVCPIANGGVDACIGQWSYGRSLGSDVRVRFRVTKLTDTKVGVPNVALKFCADVDCRRCDTPRGTATSDAQGYVDTRVSMGTAGVFSGCAEVAADGHYATLWYTAVRNDDAQIADVNLVTPTELAGLFAVVGVEQLPGRGHVSVGVWDCLVSPAADVEVTLEGADGQTVRSYWTPRQLPDPKLTKTSTSGVVSFVNVPPGAVRVIATRNGAVLAEQSFEVRADTLTALPLFPKTR